MPKKLIIFDLYNTLIVDPSIEERHLYRLNAIWSVIEKSGYPVRFSDLIEAQDHAKEQMITHQQDYFSISVFEQVRLICNYLGIRDIATIKKIYDIWAFASIQIAPEPIQNAREGLEILRENGKKTALISNTASTPGISLRFLLLEHKLYELFDDLVFSDEFGFMKPKLLIFSRVLEHMETDPKDAAFVGDHHHYDKFGAQSSGIDYIEMNPQLDFLNIVAKILSL